MEFESSKNQLGRGASAIVFKGSMGPNHIPVVVKRLQLVEIEVSEKEEEALRNLKHPNVVK
jgi:hypothetical protein